MEKQEIIKRMQENKAVCWLAWEVKNLRITFEGELDDFTVKRTDSSTAKHTMYDSLENMTASILAILGYEAQEALKVWDTFEELEILLAKDKNGEFSFIIS